MTDEISNGDDLKRAMDGAIAENERRLAADPEWSRPRHFHLQNIVAAFSVGVLNAWGWARPFRVPGAFKLVVNNFGAALADLYPRDDVVKLSLFEAKTLIRAISHRDPAFVALGMVEVDDDGKRVDDKRTLDIEAVVQNAAHCLRVDSDAFERFNEDFERRHGKGGRDGKA